MVFVMEVWFLRREDVVGEKVFRLGRERRRSELVVMIRKEVGGDREVFDLC